MINGLKSLGIDTILSFKAEGYGLGMWKYEDSLVCYQPEYLFWKKDGKLYSQKIRACYFDWPESEKTIARYSSIVQIDSTTVYSFLEEHFQSIFDSELLPMVIKQNNNGIEYYQAPVLYHPTHYFFWLNIGEEEKSKKIRTDYLKEEYGLGLKNLNYSYNLSTPIWKFMDLIYRQVTQLEERKMYSFE